MFAAFGNATHNHTAVWIDEPNVRGSWSILSNCIITISLCAWTALHLNVPEHGTANRQWLRKTKWLFLGLVAPEVVAYVSWRERLEAKNLLHDVKKDLGQKIPFSKLRRIFNITDWFTAKSKGTPKATESPSQSPTSTHLRLPDWTLVHGFYTSMGGFAIDCADSSLSFLANGRTRATLTPHGLRFLLLHEPSLVPSITTEDIQDKSKADGFKKFLVCAQAVWFVASCITRIANRLPICLLELNAVAHAACALLIYAMWWSKPLDVGEPTLIKGEKAKMLAAYMWMGSGDSVGVGCKAWEWDVMGIIRDEFDGIWVFDEPNIQDLVFHQPVNNNNIVTSTIVTADPPSQPNRNTDAHPLDPLTHPRSAY